MKQKVRYIPLLFLAISSCSDELNVIDDKNFTSFTCDMESHEEISGNDLFKTDVDDIYLSSGALQSKEFSRSGTASLKLSSEHPNGLQLFIDSPNAGTYYQAEIWQKVGADNSNLIAMVKGGDFEYNFKSLYESRNEEDGWVRHKLTFVVPPNTEELKFYSFTGGEEAYFDDFKLTRYDSIPQAEDYDGIRLNLEDSQGENLRAQITDATNYSVIPDADKEYVWANLDEGGIPFTVKMKLKGDWVDHLNSGKISYRIKVEDDLLFSGWDAFSVHHPSRRNNLNEWFVHKMATHEGILSPQYTFDYLILDDVNYGLYAVEEHFTDGMLQRARRPLGVILKFSEAGFWEMELDNEASANPSNVPYYEAAVVEAFKLKKVLKDPFRREQFDQGRNLLTAFKNNAKPVDSIFDLNELAKFYALCEITGSHHVLNWHNRRFYYNPVNERLEHILYDAMPLSVGGVSKMYMLKKLTHSQEIFESIDDAILESRAFKKLYFQELNRMCEEKYVSHLISDNKSLMSKHEAALQLEDSNYVFPRAAFLAQIKRVKSQIPLVDSLWEKHLMSGEPLATAKTAYTLREATTVLTGSSINAYLSDDKRSVHIENYHLDGVTIVGYLWTEDQQYHFRRTKEISLAAIGSTVATAFLKCRYKPKAILFKADNDPGRYHMKEVIPFAVIQ